jgi:hypothetical protein
MIRNEVMKVETNLSLKPIRMIMNGDGDPVKSYPFEKAERSFSQNVLYLCKDTPRSVKEISEMLNVPMPFVEEELEIQSNGSNGRDGLLRKLDNGKYLSTFIMLDYQDYLKIHEVILRYLDKYVDKMEQYIDKKKEDILSFPFLNKQTDLRFILWSLVIRMSWCMGNQLSDTILGKYYADIPQTKKVFYPFGFIVTPEDRYIWIGYGCDGVDADNICGYSHVELCNIYGRRKAAHFHCGLNISTTPELQLTIKAINGLDIGTLSEKEKEAAARAVEVGYLRKENDMLYPKILAIPGEMAGDFYALGNGFYPEAGEFANELAGEFNELIKKYLPKHLYGEVRKFIKHTVAGFEEDLIEKCIERGLLYAPENPLCAEGTYMVVQK